MAWYAFEVYAARRKVDPASHLAVLVGRSIANGITVAEMVEWLRPLEKHARQSRGLRQRNLTGLPHEKEP